MHSASTSISAFREPNSAYIHVPFCAHRCGYCDFTVVAGKDDLAESYLRALEIELKQFSQPKQVETLFFGGGTPTHLPAPIIKRMMDLVLDRFHLRNRAEFSVEANPAGFDEDKMDVLSRAGVNRISLGVQSFDAKQLELLERDHRRDDIVTTFERLKRRFDNISLDLIFGGPGQTLDQWRQTLRQAIELAPQHISTYGLTYEKGTRFWSRKRKGELKPVDEQIELDMYVTAIDDLAAAGFEHYEISNFARPGFRCRHNQVYWNGLTYYGFGPGAARYVNGVREINHRSVTTWIDRTLRGDSAIGYSEELSPEERAHETIVLGLRTMDGINRDEFQSRTGFDLDQLVAATIAAQVRRGLIVDRGTHIQLTREGCYVADSVVVEFL